MAAKKRKNEDGAEVPEEGVGAIALLAEATDAVEQFESQKEEN